MKRHCYKMALRAKGIKPIPPYRQLRSAYAGGQEILNPALASEPNKGLSSPARGGNLG